MPPATTQDAAMPTRIAALPVDPARKFPVPWFVEWIDGKPEFRVMDGRKFRMAIQEKRCWICGEPLGRNFTFVAGPMCGVNRTSSEPPSHTECARYAAHHCPFLTRPHMERRTDERLEALPIEKPAGHMIDRNPGVVLLWTTRTYELFSDGRGGLLFRMGPATSAEWYREGRPATRDEVAESVRTGLPLLEDIARQQDGAMDALAQALAAFEPLYPSPALTED